jgi:hypothetical protein
MMTVSKKLPLALSVIGLGALAASAEIKINDNLSTAGFVDMSLSGAKADKKDGTLNGELDQYELDFMYKFGFFSARADLNGGPGAGGGNSTVFIEQAFITSTLTNSLSLSFGKFLSCTGFEAAEPTGMYQFSYSKNMDATSPTGKIYGGYQNGVNLNFSTPTFGIYAAVVSDLWDGNETGFAKTPGGEFQVSLMPVEGVTVKAAYAFQSYGEVADSLSYQGFANVWAQYAKGPLTAAAEFNYLMSWAHDYGTPAAPAVRDDLTGMGWLAMVNYKFTDKFAATLRYSATTLDDEISSTDDMGSEVTVSPSIAISPNWLALAEVKIEFGTVEQTDYALETTYSF